MAWVRTHRTFLAACAVLLLLVLGTILLQRGPGPYTPDVAGVVVSGQIVEGNLTEFHLANGKTVTANMLDGRTVINGGIGPGVGDLLLSGTRPNGRWVARAYPGTRISSELPSGCYVVASRGTDQGDWIQTDVGLRLRKAPDFDPGPLHTAGPGARYGGIGPTFCLNSEGLVTAFR